MEKIIDFLIQNNIDFKTEEPMSKHTSFRIGGNAKIFAEVKNEIELENLMVFCKENNVEPFIIGKGSNLLVSDNGINNIVIRLKNGFEKIKLIDETTLETGAGVSLASLCKFALENSLTGLEFAYGIPGTVGGAVFMNAGAYGGQMSDVVVKTNHIDFSCKKAEVFADKLDFAYRKSFYSTHKAIITSAVLKLQKGDKKEITDKMNELFQRRKDKQPLEYPSAGSVFKRPEGHFAGALIEQCELKGKKIGGAKVSEKHAGFIINDGNATCEDVLNLIKYCQDTVFEKFGVKLETEIKKV